MQESEEENMSSELPAGGGDSTAATSTETFGISVQGEGRDPPSRQVSSISMPVKKSGVCGASSNMVNSIVGSGIIGLPFAVGESGIVMGVFLIVLVAYLTDKSLRLIVELAYFHPRLKNLGVHTFEDLMSLPFGRKGTVFTLSSMFLLAYGAMVSYLLIIKDTVPVIFGVAEPSGGDKWFARNVVMLITSFAIMLPLSLQRDMASLSITSVISVSADVILVFFVMIFSPIKDSVGDAGGFGKVLEDNFINSRIFVGLGVISVAMACQHSAFIVSNSLAERTATNWAMVAFRSTAIAAVMCTLMGLFGFLGYLGETQGNILNNFDPDSARANAARAFLAATMFFTYPMEAFVARQVLIKILFDGDMDGHITNENGESVPGPKMLGILGRREQWTIIIYIATLLPAIIFTDLGPVLSITGSVAGSCIAYIAPGLAYLGVNGDAFLDYFTEKANKGTGHKKSDDNIELPVVGDASASMQTPSPAESSGGPKPWWWYIFLFPIWCKIAATGSGGMQSRIAELEAAGARPEASHDDAEAIGPCRRDYFMSIFFIVFGVVAMVLGVWTNVYVQVKNIFFTTG